jgi:8-oxo-dGTP diphosphatase
MWLPTGNDLRVTEAELTATPAAPDMPGAPDIPAIPASAGALIFDQAGQLLILKPTYKTGWTIPGGVMEGDGETPWDACRREVYEECGLEVQGGRLACVDFRPSRPERPGGIRFLFDCGAFNDAELAGITVQPEEVAEYQLVALDVAFELLRAPIRRRVRAATRHRRCVYLENGHPVDGLRLGRLTSPHGHDDERQRDQEPELTDAVAAQFLAGVNVGQLEFECGWPAQRDRVGR